MLRALFPLLILASGLPVTARGAEKAEKAKADRPLALRTAEALYDGVSTAELPNGLRVFLKPVKGSTSVTTMVVYKVGSADEDKAVTGLSHYLEHLMFKG